MPKGIHWDAGDSPRRAFGARQDARGRRNGHAFECDVIGTKRFLECYGLYLCFAGICTGSSSFFKTNFAFHLFYNVIVLEIVLLWGLTRTSCPKLEHCSFCFYIIVGSPGLSVIPPPLRNHCAAVLSIFAPWRE